MKTSNNRPIHQLIKAVMGERRIGVFEPFDDYIAQNPSVFDLIKLGSTGLEALGLSQEEAHSLKVRGDALALYIARVFREQSLRPGHLGAQNGGRVIARVPTYAELFKPDFSACSPVDALESTTSTTAYLVELREWVRDNLVPLGDKDRTLPLEVRRPDVDKHLIDPMAVNHTLSALEIVNRVLEAQISAKHPNDSIDDLLRRTRFHNGLPFDPDWASITYVIKAALGSDSLGELIARTDTDYPYFKSPGARGSKSDIALRQSTDFGPIRQALLLEAPYFPLNGTQAAKPLRRVDPRTRLIDPDPEQSADEFYKDNFDRMALIDMRQLWAFSMATQLAPAGVEALLGLAGFAPKLSENAPALVDSEKPDSGAYFGAAFIHAEQSPAITLSRGGPANNFQLHNVGEESGGLLEHRMDRINRKCRLDRWLGLPSHEVDQLLMAAIHAERRGDLTTSVWITDNTLRALGLFQVLRTDYECSAEEFAAFIDVMSVYGLDEQLSHFDRVYNRQSLYLEPLKIDDVEFAIIPRTEADERTVQQICSGLGINFETYRYLATVIAKAFELKTHLKRNLQVFSSFYRLVRLARLLGVTPVEATALLQTLGKGDDWVAQLAGAPRVATYMGGESTDVLSVIRALMDGVRWSRSYNIGVLWLVQNVNPVVVPAVWSEAQERLFQQLHSQVKPVLLIEAMLLEEGVPALVDKVTGESRSWLPLFDALVDEHGLVKGDHGETEDQYLEYAQHQIMNVLEEEMPGDDESIERERIQALLLSVLLRIRAEQHSVVQEALAVFFVLRSELVPWVLFWAQGHAYPLLQQAMVPDDNRRSLEEPDPADPFLKMLAELERRSKVATGLALSPEMLATLLTGDQYQWFGLESPYEMSIKTVYFLAFYGRMLTLARQPEARILDYLRQVNQLPDDLSEDGMRLVRDAAADKLAAYFGCGIRHVLECADQANPVDPDSEVAARPLLRTLAHLDLLVRTLELSRQGLDATTGFMLGRLTPRDLESVYTAAAQTALESLAKSATLKIVEESGEVGQSVTTRCTVDSTTLIANLAQEVAVFDITLLDFYGEPLKGVDIEWATDLGYLLDSTTRTDHLGRATARLQAGSRMGTAHVRFNLLMRDPSYAPSVVIGCDEASLNFPSMLMFPSLLPKEPVLAGHLTEVEVSATLVDNYGNYAAFRPVAWATTHGRIRPSETVTDKNGVTRVRISSLSAGEAEVSVTYPNNEHSADFNGEITFEERPRILDKPYVISQAVQDQVLKVQCKVVGLGGQPVEGEIVNWWTSESDTRLLLESDVGGLCTFELASVQGGELIVYAQRGNDAIVSVEVQVASDAVIQSYSVDYRYPVAGAREPSMLWVDIKEEANQDAAAIANYPIEWTVHRIEPEPEQMALPILTERIATNAEGRSSFPFKQSTPGQYRVTATMVGKETETEQFELEVIPAFIWRVTLTTISTGEVQTSSQLELFRGEEYELEIVPEDLKPLKDSKGAMGWSSEYERKALGLEFDPPLAEHFTFEDDQKQTWKIKAGDLKNGTFQLGLRCDRLNEALILEGTLIKRPLPKRPRSA
ncbi:virulence plasmid 28 protein [Pseudomonas caspiana]|nr:Ig-like domain-containing protein [Pseudomonas caspiana]TPG96708.1 virulence plasmid 28 protein [Pseudomonas caspiana]